MSMSRVVGNALQIARRLAVLRLRPQKWLLGVEAAVEMPIFHLVADFPLG